MPRPKPDPSVPYNPADWRQGVIKGLGGVWYDSALLGALDEWAQSEGMPAASHNPLAASDRLAGDRFVPPYAQPWYPSVAACVALYIRKFQSSIYAAIGRALVGGTPADLWAAVNASPWCRGCQNGHYPVVLYNALRGGLPPTSAPPTRPVTDPATRPPPPPGRQPSTKEDSWDPKVSYHGQHLGRLGSWAAGAGAAIRSAIR